METKAGCHCYHKSNDNYNNNNDLRDKNMEYYTQIVFSIIELLSDISSLLTIQKSLK